MDINEEPPADLEFGFNSVLEWCLFTRSNELGIIVALKNRDIEKVTKRKQHFVGKIRPAIHSNVTGLLTQACIPISQKPTVSRKNLLYPWSTMSFSNNCADFQPAIPNKITQDDKKAGNNYKEIIKNFLPYKYISPTPTTTPTT